MQFDINITPAEIPVLLSRFVAITGAAAWKRRGQDFTHEIQANPLMERYFATQFAIESAMMHVVKYRANTGGRLPEPIGAVGQLYGFAGMIARVYGRLPPIAQDRLKAKIAGALKDNVGLAPLAFEMRTVEHFMKAGFDVDFYDLCHSGGCDFVVRKDDIAVDVECKSISGDVGRKIHLLRQYQLGPVIYQAMSTGVQSGKIRVVVATVPDRLFPQREFMTAVGSAIVETLSATRGIKVENVCTTTYHETLIASSPFDHPKPSSISENDVVEYCSDVVGEDIRQALTIFTPRRNAIVIGLRSAKPDNFLRGVFRELKEGARQLSRSRPGMLCIQFRNMTSVGLRDVAGAPQETGKPTAIQLMTHAFFDSGNRNHVHTVAYIAPGDFVKRSYRLGDRQITEIGEDAASYVFTNKRHPAETDPRYRVFR